MKSTLLKVLIIGYGSIGQKHAKILKKFNCKIKVLTKQKKIPYTIINNKSEIIQYNPDYIIISNNTSKHVEYLNFLEKNFSNKIVLTEKPISDKYKKLKLKNNKYIVGYNLRFHPVIQFIKKEIKKKSINFISINVSTYLPEWRKNINYEISNSARKNYGGGLILELSHELDYIRWIFGNIKLFYSFNKHISNLKIDTDDILILFGEVNKKIKIIFNMNFFSRINQRSIQIDGKDFSLRGDLIKNHIEIFSNNEKKKYNWDSFKISKTYIQEHQNVFKKDFKDFCTLDEAMNTLKFIEKIKGK
jgi:CMP-N,N'-diacetyllegionaminic acid synthase